MSASELFKGKVAVIAGAGSGVGEATALLFAEAGARVVAVGRRQEKLAAVAARWQGANEIETHAADVSDAQAVEQLAQSLANAHGDADFVVCCAGINVPKRGLFDTAIEDFDKVFAVNARGPFNLLRSFAPPMMKQRRGTFVIVSSIAGYSLPAAVAGVAYSSSKAAALTIAAMAREELRSYGINVSCYCPGVINTPILDDRPVPPPAEQRAKFLQAQDCAEDILHLCSRPARGGILNMVSVPSCQTYSGDMGVS